MDVFGKWSEERLRELVSARIGDSLLIAISNREPYIHVHSGERIECLRPASGLVTGIDPVMRACGGIWIAHGGGDADREVVDADNKILVPEDEKRYVLKQVWTNDKGQEDVYY